MLNSEIREDHHLHPDILSYKQSLCHTDSTLAHFLLFGSAKQAFDVKTKILNLTIQFLKDSDRFDEPLI